MKKQEVEAWTRKICDQIKKNQQVEDGHVELKADLIDAKKAARRIAGMCNAASPEPCLLILGLDEKKGATGVSATESDVVDWKAQVFAEFAEKQPVVLQHVSLEVDGKTLHAMLLASDEAPYLVKNPTGQGAIAREVPWRDATGVRTATRGELLRILVSTVRLPEIDLIGGTLTVQRGKLHDRSRDDTADSSFWHVYVQFMVIPRTADPLVIPAHRCSVLAHLSTDSWACDSWLCESVTLKDEQGSPQSQIVVASAAKMSITAYSNFNEEMFRKNAEAHLRIVIQPAGSRNPIRLNPILEAAPPQGKELARWIIPPDFMSDETYIAALQFRMSDQGA
ncbi:MAG: hypothetical protein O7G85_15935 [Planctomycetota bacterium]|nr:hypothetical protein [Planctomycetota bacterium]